MRLTLTQHDMAYTLTSNYDCIEQDDAVQFIAQVFPDTPTRDADAIAAYVWIDYDFHEVE